MGSPLVAQIRPPTAPGAVFVAAAPQSASAMPNDAALRANLRAMGTPVAVAILAALQFRVCEVQDCFLERELVFCPAKFHGFGLQAIPAVRVARPCLGSTERWGIHTLTAEYSKNMVCV